MLQLFVHVKCTRSLLFLTLFLQCDIVDERLQVSPEEGRALAQSFGVPFFVTSAKDRINVDEAFFELVGQVVFFCCAVPLCAARFWSLHR